MIWAITEPLTNTSTHQTHILRGNSCAHSLAQGGLTEAATSALSDCLADLLLTATYFSLIILSAHSNSNSTRFFYVSVTYYYWLIINHPFVFASSLCLMWSQRLNWSVHIFSGHSPSCLSKGYANMVMRDFDWVWLCFHLRMRNFFFTVLNRYWSWNIILAKHMLAAELCPQTLLFS